MSNARWGREQWEISKVQEPEEAIALEITKQRRGGPKGPDDTRWVWF